MQIIDRYILKQLATGFILILLSMTVLIWLTQSLRMIDMIVTKGVSPKVFLHMTLLVLPNFVQILAPLVLFAVVLFVFIRMQSDKELMVLQAVGMSPSRIMRPALWFAIALTLIGYFMTLAVIPQSNAALREMKWKIRNDLSHLLLQEGQFNSFKNGLTIYVRERASEGHVRGVLAYEAKDKEKVSMLSAQEGVVFQDPDGLRVVFQQGARHELNPLTKQFSILKFDKYTMLFGDKNTTNERRSTDVRELRLGQLLAASREQAGSPALFRRYKVEALKRLTQPLYNFTFVFLAMIAVLARFYDRRGQVGRINAVVIAAVLVQSFALAFENMASKNLLLLPLMALNLALPILAVRLNMRRRQKKAGARAAALVLALLAAGGAAAAEKAETAWDTQSPVGFEARTVRFDQQENRLTASGDVVLTQNGAVLEADEVLYDKGGGQIRIPESFVITLADGSVIQANNAVLSQDFYQLQAQNASMRLFEGTLLTARGIERSEGGRMLALQEATYTPCDTCAGQSALWRLRAKDIQRDDVKKTLTFKHFFLDVKETPVVYFPYLQIPDFSVKRKTGLLPWTLSHGSEMKGGITTPFFINLSPHQNLTLTPTLTLKHDPLVIADYQGLFPEGFLNLTLSGSQDNDGHNQAHVRTSFQYDLSEKWRATGELFKVANDTYFRRYPIPQVDESQSFLTSHLSLARFGTRSFFKATGYSFQSLQEGVSGDTIPILLPVADYQYTTRPFVGNVSAFSQINAAAFNTREHFKSNRLSLTQGIKAPYVTPFGMRLDMTAAARADAYAIDTGSVSFAGQSPNKTYETLRVFPSVALEAGYPLVRVHENATQVLEPMAMIVVAPNGGNDDKIPNADSLVFDFDDTNLFSENRFVGYDRIETGTRVNYGLKWSLFNARHTRALSALFGQSYRFREETQFGELMGYNPHFSDYVGKVQMDYQDFSLAYRFRLDQNNLAPQKNELMLTAGRRPLRIGVDYIFSKRYKIADSVYPEREELLLTGSSHVAKDWQLGGYYRYDLSSGGGPIEAGGTARYDNECLALVFEVGKSFTKDRDYRGNTSFMLKVILKTLGGY